MDEEARFDEAQPTFTLFDDEGNMVPDAKEVVAAWEAQCAADLEKADTLYQAAQRKFLGNTEVLSALPSHVDQLRSRALASPPSLAPPSFQVYQALMARLWQRQWQRQRASSSIPRSKMQL